MKAALILIALVSPTVFAWPSLHRRNEWDREVALTPSAVDHQRTAHEWPEFIPPGEGDVRSPCPMLNALANHGVLPRDGRGITVSVLREALMGFLKVSRTVTAILELPVSQKGKPTTASNEKAIDLEMLQEHGFIEHDVSLTRHDIGLGDGSSITFDPALYEQFRSYATAHMHGQLYMIESDLARYRKDRYDDLARQHHRKNSNWSLSAKDKAAGLLETALIVKQFSDPDRDGYIRMDWLDVFFREERLPFELGWEPRDMCFASFAMEGIEMLFQQYFS